MISEVDATLVNGVLQPDQALPLPDRARVHLTIEVIADRTSLAREAWQAIQDRLRDRPLHFGSQRLTRDEMHERERWLCRFPALNPHDRYIRFAGAIVTIPDAACVLSL